MTAEQNRAFERSSAFRAMVVRAGKAAWQTGMDLLKQIHAEEKEKLNAVWSAPDADEFASKIKQITPPVDTKLIEETMSAYEGDKSLAKKIHAIVEDNRHAKKELAELAKKI